MLSARKSLLALRNRQLLSNLNLVRIVKLVPISIKDAHVFVRVSVLLFADFGKIVTCLDRVGFPLTLSATDRGSRCPSHVDINLGSNIVLTWIDQLYLVPKLIFCIFRWCSPFDVKLVVLHVQILKLNLLLIGHIQYRLVFLLQLVEALLCA